MRGLRLSIERLVLVFAIALCAPVARAQTASLAGGGTLKVQYGAVDASKADLAQARQTLIDYAALDKLRAFLSALRLPRDLVIVTAQCGSERRDYRPDPATVTICYEEVAKIIAVVKQKADPNTDNSTLIIGGAVIDAMLRETAIGIFDVLHVPVWGRVEDAADELAAFLMLQFGEDTATITLQGTTRYLMLDSTVPGAKDFVSAQSPEIQRFFNYFCIAWVGYGFDVKTLDLVDELYAPDRLSQCQAEFSKVRKAFNLRIMPYIDPDRLIRTRASGVL